MASRKKIALIGAGQIGGTTALMCGQRNLGDVVLVDIMEGVAKGKALDLQQTRGILKFDVNVTGGGTTDYSIIKDADVCIVTAGVPRKPGMSRDDLLKVNLEEVVAAHAGLAGDARSHDANVRVLDDRVVGRSATRHVHVELEDAPGLLQVERLALRDALHDVHEDDVAEVPLAAQERHRAADLPGADERDLLASSHVRPCPSKEFRADYMCLMISSPNSEHFTSTVSATPSCFIRRAKS